MTEPSSRSSSLHPARELLARYMAILGAAWQARHELAGPQRLADEAAFLPAALSLQATPVHPAPRRAAIAICALFAIALLWARFGQVDIVAVAPGRIVVSQRTKTIQPLDASVVKRVLVRDGDAVRAGQVLVELDPTNAQTDQSSVQEQLKAAEADLQRSQALLEALDSGRTPHLPPLPLGEGRAHLQAEWQDIQASLAKLAAEHTRRQAEAATVRETIAKLDATLPIARQREADMKSLAEAAAATREAEQSKAAYLAETRRMLRERQTKAKLEREQLGQQRNKTEQRQRPGKPLCHPTTRPRCNR